MEDGDVDESTDSGVSRAMAMTARERPLAAAGKDDETEPMLTRGSEGLSRDST